MEQGAVKIMEILEHGIQLKPGQSASQILHLCLNTAVESYPSIFSSIDFPTTSKNFKDNYIEVVPQFEAARINHPERADIAELLATTFQEQIIFRDDSRSILLQEKLAHPAESLELERLPPNTEPGWQPKLQFLGEDWPNLSILGQALLDENIVSTSAKEAMDWLAQLLDTEKSVDLSGRKVVIFGASAEMAPTEQFSAAGANILWLDLAPPSKLKGSKCRAGEVSFPKNGINLLTQPCEAMATILAYSKGQPLDFCLYAYAPGQTREMRLGAAMNAIVNAVPSSLIRTITLLLSPTTATPLSSDDLLALHRRKKNRPSWEAILDSLGLLGKGGGATRQGKFGASNSLVAIQGASYQTAQYLAKLMMAEKWSKNGSSCKENNEPTRVSANTAPITQTRSIAHPIFDAAFQGAAALGVQTFTPLQSQTLNGLLAVHDWLNPKTSRPGRIKVHGGIHTLPYPINSALRVAALIGFAQSPKLIGGLLKK